MKAYTDLEQSKKLAEILPLESADMHYNNGYCRGVDYIEPFSAELMPYQEALHLMKIHKTNFMFQVIPCWSLAALLNVIPKYIRDNNILRIDIDEKDFAIWYDKIGYGVNIDLPDITTQYAVDACVELIIKLKEQNLL